MLKFDGPSLKLILNLQIMAIYEEENDGIPSLQHIAGDGTSASSVGTSSPDIFQVGQATRDKLN